jgi:hypothetical protein
MKNKPLLFKTELSGFPAADDVNLVGENTNNIKKSSECELDSSKEAGLE